MIIKANEVRKFQDYDKIKKRIEYILNQKIITVAKAGYSKMEIKLYDFDYFEKEIIKQLLKEGGYKFRMTTWDDTAIIEW